MKPMTMCSRQNLCMSWQKWQAIHLGIHEPVLAILSKFSMKIYGWKICRGGGTAIWTGWNSWGGSNKKFRSRTNLQPSKFSKKYRSLRGHSERISKWLEKLENSSKKLWKKGDKNYTCHRIKLDVSIIIHHFRAFNDYIEQSRSCYYAIGNITRN